MNRTLSLLALTSTLALGALVGYDLRDRALDRQAAPVTAAPVTAGQPTSGQMVPALATAPATEARARTESEANTVEVVRARRDGLVYISVTEGDESSAEAQLRRRLQEQLPFNFGLPEGGPRTGTGSGFFVTAGGDIITNNHVVEGAGDITIRLHGSTRTYKAEVVARAPDFDLALLRAKGVPTAQIKPIPLGNSDGLDVGLKAIAMGAPFGLDFSVSEGIISSLERQVPVGTRAVEQSVIQTDAAINPGNSGGPLLNSAGQVIGVNTQILTGGIGQSAGVGFAIPVNTVKKLLPQLQAGKGGQDAVIQTPSLGIVLGEVGILSAAQRQRARLPEAGALVRCVYDGSPAQAARLQGALGCANLETPQAEAAATPDLNRADVITAFDGQPVASVNDLRAAVLGKRPGDRVTLKVQRAGQTREVQVTLKVFQFPVAQE
ncbi:S1C family serine protease [Deinococcus arcticus]|uniref:Serine protease n=1 Tax=Deinococcus arcticus TaxID=2136176 RepID=A0A2T3WBN5_9DEIO|nr:trypsin-like peptidase domain-containing protein [Deinococcus arcticus]PTA69319.1 serine protease [Deinococcus arcticus]